MAFKEKQTGLLAQRLESLKTLESRKVTKFHGLMVNIMRSEKEMESKQYVRHEGSSSCFNVVGGRTK